MGGANAVGVTTVSVVVAAGDHAAVTRPEERPEGLVYEPELLTPLVPVRDTQRPRPPADGSHRVGELP